MKKGINAWSFAPGTSPEEVLRLSHSAGFQGAELVLGETGKLSLESSPQELVSLRGRAEELGIEIHSLATMLQLQYNMVSDNPVVRQKALDATKVQIETAKVLGAETALVVPGYVGVDFIPDAETVRYDRAYDRALEAFSELAPFAEAAGIRIGVENVWNRFLTTPREMRGFLDEVDSHYVGSYFDIGNALGTGFPEQWIEILGHRIVKVHVKDYRTNPGGLSSFVDLLSGDVNFPEVLRALTDVGFNDYCSAEVTPYRWHPEQSVYNASASMDRIFGWNQN
ncbi:MULTISPECIES: sugar phosphate isomerase/epimerase [Paenarthrobacter]|uniref:Sugar phosphate isomerase/epimerase n=1 Tax=Paenarthrobacter ureafaciens TaxID=37931 RepID=A0AAX3EMY9_PAEUR|nr:MULTISPECIES: sugar phosphate isomerase/epimerase family protein [Paenarthrobacter]NKR13563.1 xylulose 5-phosphate 3-epimerase [Arthrobacter sp. M5]NKR15450.1 xylulose 5-phosphate 3-epimerase [Arthrobacter sp. M6]OEH59315.1 xylulose 5-phosphate 3-epimerase [Arthrobacter sp. D2]OEH60702.1 xylulose 5-phosphate 3-epimerase [Arthrobacter sp. D4]MDO5864373.1 sugar phosphate isomerase/epimerase [Paenarthrobacter sp. SD-2]